MATVTGMPGERDLRNLATGVQLEDGRTQPAEVELVGTARGLAQVRPFCARAATARSAGCWRRSATRSRS